MGEDVGEDGLWVTGVICGDGLEPELVSVAPPSRAEALGLKQSLPGTRGGLRGRAVSAAALGAAALRVFLRLQGEDRLLHPSQDQHPGAAGRRRVRRPEERPALGRKD